jgi:ABC-type lipoprotein export system ATPase subunit
MTDGRTVNAPLGRDAAEGAAPVGGQIAADALQLHQIDRANALLRATAISKRHGTGDAAVQALHPCDVELFAGTITVIVGPSGSGKSTLMHVLSGLDTPTSGRVLLAGTPLSDLSKADRARWRARHMGFVLQRDNLIPSLSLEENVAAPLLLAGTRRREALARARAALADVDLVHRAHAFPATVSGGEAQRAAVARACAGSPRLIFSDEPTGALDSAASRIVLDLLMSRSARTGAATLLVTHDPAAARVADVVIRIEDGRLTRLDQA